MRMDAMLAKATKPSNLMSREVIPIQSPFFFSADSHSRFVER
jgi:hypothetical protein